MSAGVCKTDKKEDNLQKKWDVYLQKEWSAYLSKRRSSEPSDWRNRLTGLAISGGGIRSAAFSLGVLQKLASKKLLSSFDYLSTVSGGGFTGGSVSYYLNHPAFNHDGPKYDLEDKFPYGDPDKAWHSPTPELNYLRSHGNYLVPDRNINLVSFFGVVLRAVLLNLMIWLPVMMLVMALAQRLIIINYPEVAGSIDIGVTISFPWIFDPWAWVGIAAMVVTLVSWLLIEKKTATITDPDKIQTWIRGRTFNWLSFLVGAWLFSCRVIATSPTLKQLKIGLGKDSDTWWQALKEVFASVPVFWLTEVPVLFKLVEAGALVLAVWYIYLIISYSLSTIGQKDQTEYPRRRQHTILYGKILLWLTICIAIALVPYLSKAATLVGGIGALIVGIAMGLRKLYQSGKQWISLEAIAPVAALLVFYGLFITAYDYAYRLYPDISSHRWGIYIVTLVAILLGYCANLNHVSVARYYRDRLMEAFMPSAEMVSENKNEASQGANVFEIGALAGSRNTPYHLVNTNAVLMDSKNKKVSDRGGDSFILSPLYVGSQATGWMQTERFYRNKFTLATAVAISAAAVNPHAGPAGEGLSRNRAVSLLMALLNLRLGYWVPNPRFPNAPTRMHHFWSGWYELSPTSGYNESSTFVQLSDGGHFDNLGLYELFRRGVRFILVLDGSGDKDFQFSDLQNALHRAEQDFKVRVKFKPPIGDLIPQKQNDVNFPEGLKLASRGYVSGRFTYGPDDPQPPGWIFFLKTTLTGDMSMRIRGYKGAHPDFPDETTADQFFDEDQFDAYRLLGNEIATKMIQDEDSKFKEKLEIYFSDQDIPAAP
jgi:hypothetical protein